MKYLVALSILTGLGLLFWACSGSFTISTRGPPVAIISAVPSRGEAPLEVSFQSLSAGDVTAWTWDLGDGVMAATPALTHIYTEGEYTACLTARGPQGTDSACLTIVAEGGDDPPDGDVAIELEQRGIGWSFSTPRPVGRFANGDWWVLGPVSIIAITPEPPPGRARHGSMLDPSPDDGGQSLTDPWLGVPQGLDEGTYTSVVTYSPTYLDTLNVRNQLPLSISSGSLLSTITAADAGQLPQVESAAILTVVSSIPDSDAFRPAYSDDGAVVRYRASSIDWSIFADLELAPGAPTPQSSQDKIQGPWLDFVSSWPARFVRPRTQQPNYDREAACAIGEAAILLNSAIDSQAKRQLAYRMIQLGIDMSGIGRMTGPRHWMGLGGHSQGRWLPIVIASVALRDPSLKPVGIGFAELQQTFYVTQEDIDRGGGYTQQDLGLPEWGPNHALSPELSRRDWYADQYRVCCTANCWWGHALAVRAMGIESDYGHDALLDYMDRYRSECLSQGCFDYMLAWDQWQLDMWDLHVR